MKYEIEIDDALVPEGGTPIRFGFPVAGEYVNHYGALRIVKAGDVYGRCFIFRDKHVPKIPDFVPDGWWITKCNAGFRIWRRKPAFDVGCFRRPDNQFWKVGVLNFDRDALFGDLPPEQCCFQQKGNG